MHASLKTRFVALNFEDAPAVWLQAIERRRRITDWQHFWELVFAKFDKDQYQLHLRQMDSLKQTGSMANCQRRSEEFAHGILFYNSASDDTYSHYFLGRIERRDSVCNCSA